MQNVSPDVRSPVEITLKFVHEVLPPNGEYAHFLVPLTARLCTSVKASKSSSFSAPKHYRMWPTATRRLIESKMRLASPTSLISSFVFQYFTPLITWAQQYELFFRSRCRYDSPLFPTAILLKALRFLWKESKKMIPSLRA